MAKRPSAGASKNSQTKPSGTGARSSAQFSPLQSYFRNHLKVSKLIASDLRERPLASLMTCSVIGVALVLPTLLLIILANLQTAEISWDGSAEITLFLSQDTSEVQGAELASRIGQRGSIQRVEFINKNQALEEFGQQFELEGVIDSLDENPLPHAVVVQPSNAIEGIDTLISLKQSLAELPEVESALLDALWIKRLQSISSFLTKSVLILGVMLAIAVILILGNTIRLAIENRKEEIAVLKLVGGTDAFVCRPFLYMGLLFGLGGSVVAIILTHVILAILYGPLQELSASYQSSFSLSGLNLESTLLLLGIGTGLGWLGAWFAVNRHLHEIEPD